MPALYALYVQLTLMRVAAVRRPLLLLRRSSAGAYVLCIVHVMS